METVQVLLMTIFDTGRMASANNSVGMVITAMTRFMRFDDQSPLPTWVCWPKRSTLSAMTGLGPTALTDALNFLEQDLGVMTRDFDGRKVRFYFQLSHARFMALPDYARSCIIYACRSSGKQLAAPAALSRGSVYISKSNPNELQHSEKEEDLAAAVDLLRRVGTDEKRRIGTAWARKGLKGTGLHSIDVAQRAIAELRNIREREQIKEPGKLLYTLLRDNAEQWLEEAKSKAIAKANSETIAVQSEHARIETETLEQINWQAACKFYSGLSVEDRRDLVDCWFDAYMPTMKGRQAPRMRKMCEQRDLDKALYAVFNRADAKPQ